MATRTVEQRERMREGMKQWHSERTPQPVTCPACGKGAWWVALDKILTHMDGTSNRKCWETIAVDRLEVIT